MPLIGILIESYIQKIDVLKEYDEIITTDEKYMKNKPNTSDPNIAVIGSGYWGRNLVRNYHQLGALRLVCDRNDAVLLRFQEQYPDLDICCAYTDVLYNEDIAGVVIATPVETHYNLAREALMAGKHVYVEKPLVFKESEADELISLAREKNRVLMVGHLMQYHPVFIQLKKLVQKGDLGRINYIYSHRLNLGKIRREENILWSFAPHDISMILTLAGEEPETIIATGGNYLHKSIADVTTTTLEFPSGMKSHIFVSWLHPFKEQKLVVVGDRKMAVLDDIKPWSEKLLMYAHSIEWKNNLPVPHKADPEKFDIPENEPLRLECEHFLECITEGKQPLTSGDEGLRVLRVLNACQRSLDESGVRVTVNSDAVESVLPDIPGDCFIHPTAVIDEATRIGSGTKIWCFTHVISGSTIGNHCNVGQNVMIGAGVNVGNRCKIQNNVSIYKGVTLEDGVFCGPSMVFTNVYNPRAEIAKMDQVRETLVKRGATIGANATVVCGVTLGRYCFIGAGAVLTRDVLDYALMVGNPARQIGWACQCGERLREDLTCAVCGKSYQTDAAGTLLCLNPGLSV